MHQVYGVQPESLSPVDLQLLRRSVLSMLHHTPLTVPFFLQHFITVFFYYFVIIMQNFF